MQTNENIAEAEAVGTFDLTPSVPAILGIARAEWAKYTAQNAVKIMAAGWPDLRAEDLLAVLDAKSDGEAVGVLRLAVAGDKGLMADSR